MVDRGQGEEVVWQQVQDKIRGALLHLMAIMVLAVVDPRVLGEMQLLVFVVLEEMELHLLYREHQPLILVVGEEDHEIQVAALVDLVAVVEGVLVELGHLTAQTELQILAAAEAGEDIGIVQYLRVQVVPVVPE